MTVLDYFIWFIVYSFCGWIWETGLYIVRDKRFVNRGFLNGPLCPIYGVGACACVALLYGRVTNPILLFLFGLVICTGIEYFTHWLLEKMFHATWWDYSEDKFNLNGRICLVSAVFFGVCITLLICVVHPFMYKLTSEIPDMTKTVVCLIIYTVLLVDMTLTVNVLVDLDRKLRAIQFSISATIQSSIDNANEKYAEIKDGVTEKVTYPEHYIGSRTRSMLRRYPEYKSLRYKEALEQIRNKIKEK